MDRTPIPKGRKLNMENLSPQHPPTAEESRRRVADSILGSPGKKFSDSELV